MESKDKKEKKFIVEGDYERVVEIDDHYYLINKKDKIAVLPYTVDSRGLLDDIGVVEDWNYIEEERVLTLINDYVTTDDSTDLVAANRLLFEVLGTNVKDAIQWMYLGSIYNTMTSDSPIKLYAVDLTDVHIKSNENVEEGEEKREFKMISSEKVIQTDDVLFLAGFLRLFNYFYVSSLAQKEED